MLMKKNSLSVNFLYYGIIIFFLLSCNSRDKKDGSTELKFPNIVFILADDMGYGDPGCYNPDSKILTPNIDAIANEGIRFTNAHAPATWCVPSRYGLITGILLR
jgi:hypothetical protein